MMRRWRVLFHCSNINFSSQFESAEKDNILLEDFSFFYYCGNLPPKPLPSKNFSCQVSRFLLRNAEIWTEPPTLQIDEEAIEYGRAERQTVSGKETLISFSARPTPITNSMDGWLDGWIKSCCGGDEVELHTFAPSLYRCCKKELGDRFGIPKSELTHHRRCVYAVICWTLRWACCVINCKRQIDGYRWVENSMSYELQAPGYGA